MVNLKIKFKIKAMWFLTCEFPFIDMEFFSHYENKCLQLLLTCSLTVGGVSSRRSNYRTVVGGVVMEEWADVPSLLGYTTLNRCHLCHENLGCVIIYFYFFQVWCLSGKMSLSASRSHAGCGNVRLLLRKLNNFVINVMTFLNK